MLHINQKQTKFIYGIRSQDNGIYLWWQKGKWNGEDSEVLIIFIDLGAEADYRGVFVKIYLAKYI